MSKQPKEFVSQVDPESIAACIAEALEEEGLVIVPVALLSPFQRKQIRRFRLRTLDDIR